MTRPAPQHWIAGLAIGGISGYVFAWMHTPIPWMLGPLLVLALLRVAGAPVAAMPGGRHLGQWIIGTALGLYFTPQVVRGVAGSWPLFVAGAVFAIALGYAAGVVLARLARLDLTTGIFASVPGGAAEMTILSEQFGARTDRVAAAQSLRIMIVVVVVPAAYVLLGLHGSDLYVPGTAEFRAEGLAWLMLATLAGSAVAQRMKLPNAFVLGSLAVTIPLTAFDIHFSAMPTLATNAGQCLLGCALGARFNRDFLSGAPRFVGAVVVTVLGAIVIAVAFGWLLAVLADQNPATISLGMAPGGIAEMCITAKALQLGVPFVTAFHVTRLVVLLLLTAPLFGRMRGWWRRRVGGRR
jgi:membrane AbrB-like protein